MSSTQTLSTAQARRIALAAQGFADPAPAGAPDRRHLRRVMDRVGLLQMDSVNVVARSHYLPLFSRLGAYDRGLVEQAAWGRKSRRELFEYWGHEASLLPLGLQPLLRWRMARARAGEGVYGGLAKWAAANRPFLDVVLAEVARRGPLAAGELEGGYKAAGGWWGWSEGKRAVEWLFWAGLLTTGTRRGFERVYDLPERVMPEVCALPTPAEDEAQRGLLLVAARALGVATGGDLRDYFRLPVADTKARLAELVEARELEPVAVQGWRNPGYLWPAAARPRRVRAAALLSPFDNLIWRRERTERLFAFRFRLEIYTPAAKREHGYYVLPFLQDEALTARLDLKSDRAWNGGAGRLWVKAAHLEPGADAGAVAAALKPALVRMAQWLGLAELAATGPGRLDAELRVTG